MPRGGCGWGREKTLLTQSTLEATYLHLKPPTHPDYHKHFLFFHLTLLKLAVNGRLGLKENLMPLS